MCRKWDNIKILGFRMLINLRVFELAVQWNTYTHVLQAQMATAHRLAAQTTSASRARAVVATTKQAAPLKPSAASAEIATKPPPVVAVTPRCLP